MRCRGYSKVYICGVWSRQSEETEGKNAEQKCAEALQNGAMRVNRKKNAVVDGDTILYYIRTVGTYICTVLA